MSELKPLTTVMAGVGCMAAFVDGDQVPQIQVPWILLWAELAEKHGYDPTSCVIDLPRDSVQLRVFRLDDGSFSYQIELK